MSLPRIALFTLDEIVRAFELAIDKKLKQIQPTSERNSEKLTQKELAEFLGVTVTTVINLKKKGKIPFYKVGGRMFYLKTEVLNAIRGDPSIVKASKK